AALLEASQQAYDDSLASYRQGLGTLTDLLAARRELSRARFVELDTKVQLLQSAATLAFSTGDSPAPDRWGGGHGTTNQRDRVVFPLVDALRRDRCRDRRHCATGLPPRRRRSLPRSPGARLSEPRAPRHPGALADVVQDLGPWSHTALSRTKGHGASRADSSGVSSSPAPAPP